MSRVRASSQGNRRAPPMVAGASASSVAPSAPSQQLTLEEMRQRMLMRRNVDLQLNRLDLERPAESRPTTGHQPLFVGRSLVMTNSPPHPSNTDDAADPHKLFQMLRRKKRNAAPPAERPGHAGTPTTVPRHSPDRSAPHPSMDEAQAASESGQPTPPSVPPEVPPRPQGAHRPAPDGPPRYAFSAGPPASKRGPRPREANSASAAGPAAPDGRPATRQKLPSESLDLFPTPAGRPREGGSEADPFPKPAARKAGAKAESGKKPSSGAVNFNCLFVSGDGDLDGGHDEFPSPKTHVDIPLIETDWFSTTDTWEALPGTDEANGPPEAADFEGESSQTLYELLVAQKGRRSAKK